MVKCGTPEMYSGGSRVYPLRSLDGKIDLQALEEQVQHQLPLRPHGQKAGCVSVTQATELGTVYTVEELKAVSERCRKYQLPLHMDGARFANALGSLGVTPSEMTWKVGVDVLSFGATKNGAMCAEAIIFFNQEYAKDFDYRHKRAGQLMSKGRFFASQFLAYLENDLWLKNAAHANQMAQGLESVFKKHNIACMYSTQANELFVRMNLECAEYLWEQGCKFYAWGFPGSGLYRFVTSWFTDKRDIEEFRMILGKRNARI